MAAHRQRGPTARVWLGWLASASVFGLTACHPMGAERGGRRQGAWTYEHGLGALVVDPSTGRAYPALLPWLVPTNRPTPHLPPVPPLLNKAVVVTKADAQGDRTIRDLSRAFQVEIRIPQRPAEMDRPGHWPPCSARVRRATLGMELSAVIAHLQELGDWVGGKAIATPHSRTVAVIRDDEVIEILQVHAVAPD